MGQQISFDRKTVGPGNAVVLSVSGEIDLLTSDEFDAQLKSLLTPPHETVVLDLSGVKFLSSAGLSVLLASAEAAKASDIAFRLVTTERVILRPLEITGLNSAFTVFGSVEEALASTN